MTPGAVDRTPDDRLGPGEAELAVVDRSCRQTLLFFASKAVGWLVIGTALLLVASIKLHAPGMLASRPWLTYGRLEPAGWNTFVYGFAGQALMGLGLWLLARLARERLQYPLVACAGGVLWNFGVLFGVIGVLAGDSSGREWLEFPRQAFVLLLLGSGLISTSGWMTFAARIRAELYPSAWFILVGLTSFLWFGATAAMLLGDEPVRGILQVLVQRWYTNGIVQLWIGALSLALLFYYLPLIAGRPLASRQLALLGFWTLVFSAPWMVTAHGDPVPRWIVSCGVAARMVAPIAVLAIGLNWWWTMKRPWTERSRTLSGQFILVAAASYVVAGLIGFATAFRLPAAITRFTWLQGGVDWLLVGGFAALTVFAALPEALAAAVGRPIGPVWLKAHFWLTLTGVILIAVPQCFGGLVQGIGLADPARPFMEVLGTSMHFVRLSTLGLTLFLFGQVALTVGVLDLWRAIAVDCRKTIQSWAAVSRTEAAGVRG